MERPVLTDEIKGLIKKFAKTQPEQIALMRSKDSDVPFAFVAQQIKGRRRIQKKLPSWFANENVAFPKSLSLEQCSSELAAQYKSGLVETGQVGLDLTGGFGVDAHSFAQRFDRFYYFEQNEELAEIVDWNFKQFGLGSKVVARVGDGLTLLDEIDQPVDFIFVDPARRNDKSQKVSAFDECEPNLVAVWDKLLAKAGTIMVKASPGLDISLGVSQLKGVFEVHVVSIANECKELLFLARADFEGSPKIHCINIEDTENRSTFSFTLEEESATETIVGIPTNYLYEPNASIMKAGAFKSICAKYGVMALNPRTRLYCSNTFVSDFPGRIFKIVGKGSINTTDAKRLFPKRKVNLISRNSGMTTDELRKKLKFKDGGSQFAIAAAVSDVGRQLFACELVKQESK